jgi:hypothetical protein
MNATQKISGMSKSIPIAARTYNSDRSPTGSSMTPPASARARGNRLSHRHFGSNHCDLSNCLQNAALSGRGPETYQKTSKPLPAVRLNS